MEHQKKIYFCFPRLSSVTIATGLSGSTLDFLKLLFNMFPYNEILTLAVRRYLVPTASAMISKSADSTNFNFGRPLGLSMTGRKPVGLTI